jgi:hypothetical protein
VKLLEHKDLGITEEDIETETNPAQLLYWKTEIQADLVAIKGQIERAKVESLGGEYMEPEKWHSLKYVKGCYGILTQKIQARLTELKTQCREKAKTEKETDSRLFVNMAKMELKEEIYMRIWDRVKELKAEAGRDKGMNHAQN